MAPSYLNSKPPPRNAPVWEWRRWRASVQAAGTTPAAPPISPPPPPPLPLPSLPPPPPRSFSWAGELSPPQPPPPQLPADELVLDASIDACHVCHLDIFALYMIFAIIGVVRVRRYMHTVRPYAAVRKSDGVPPAQGQFASSLRDNMLGIWHTWRGYSRQGSGRMDKVEESSSGGSCSTEFISEGSPGWATLAPGRSLSCGGEEVYTDPPTPQAGPSS